MFRAGGAHARGAGGLLAACTLALCLLGCLERQGPGEPGYSAEVRGRRARIPALEGDDLLRTQVDANDGINPMLSPLRSGFAAGQQVYFWDLGPTALMFPSLEPLYTLRRRTPAGDAPVDHPDLIDSVPGDASYSPLRARFIVYVTGAYDGERIASLRALEDAIDLGLVEEPAPAVDFVHRPVALASARLPLPDGSELAPEPVYYRGKVAHQFRLGGDAERVREIPMMGPLLTPSVYVLRRRNQSTALDETVMAADLDGDGDQNDTNYVLAAAAADPRNVGLWTEQQVTVVPSYAFGAAKQESDLFMRKGPALEANPDVVLDFRPAATRRQLLLLEAGDE